MFLSSFDIFVMLNSKPALAILNMSPTVGAIKSAGRISSQLQADGLMYEHTHTARFAKDLTSGNSPRCDLINSKWFGCCSRFPSTTNLSIFLTSRPDRSIVHARLLRYRRVLSKIPSSQKSPSLVSVCNHPNYRTLCRRR